MCEIEKCNRCSQTHDICFIQSSYRLAIRTEGMIYDLVKNIKSENQELQMHCASAIFKVGCSSVGTFDRKNNTVSLCAMFSGISATYNTSPINALGIKTAHCDIWIKTL